MVGAPSVASSSLVRKTVLMLTREYWLAEDFWRRFANSFLPVGDYCGNRDVRHRRRYMAVGLPRGAVKGGRLAHPTPPRELQE